MCRSRCTGYSSSSMTIKNADSIPLNGSRISDVICINDRAHSVAHNVLTTVIMYDPKYQALYVLMPNLLKKYLYSYIQLLSYKHQMVELLKQKEYVIASKSLELEMIT